MLTQILLITTLAAAPADAVLVLKSGGAMVVKSYEVDGKLVRIVGAKGEPLVMRVSKVDLEASEAATERRRARDVAEPVKPAVRPARAPAARQSLLAASDAAIERGSSGGMSVADASAPRTTPKAPTRNALIGGGSVRAVRTGGPAPKTGALAPIPPVRPGAMPDGKDTAAWQALFDGLRADWKRQTARYRQLAKRYKTMDVGWRDAHGRDHIDPSAMVERGAIGAQMQSIEATFAELHMDFASLKETARRAGVKPIVYRRGIK